MSTKGFVVHSLLVLVILLGSDLIHRSGIDMLQNMGHFEHGTGVNFPFIGSDLFLHFFEGAVKELVSLHLNQKYLSQVISQNT
jgi:hypothetical protein